MNNTEPESIRLNRYLAMCGLGSRRRCDEIVAAGRIFINGNKVVELGSKVNVSADRVEYMGKVLTPVRRLQYIAFHKPGGVIVTRSDPQGRTTIYDEIAKRGIDAAHLKYVGRLDYNSEGLLLLTNDGELVHALTHPRFQIKKVYRVRTAKTLTSGEQEKLIAGIRSEGQLLHAAGIKKIESDKSEQSWYEIVLFEGKNRQIRRMLESVGNEVWRLIRVQFSSVKLGDLRSGEVRPLTQREVMGLRNVGYKS